MRRIAARLTNLTALEGMKYIVEIITFAGWPVVIWLGYFLSTRAIRYYERKQAR